jgi:hypothetical protein
MRFRVAEQHKLGKAHSPFRVAQRNGQEVEWTNRFLDQQRVRGVADSTLRSYAHDLLHFLRWWAAAQQTAAIAKETRTETTFLDYIRWQVDQHPAPAAASINRRVGTVERALRLEFPDAPRLFCARLSELVLATITAGLWTSTSGADSAAGEDTQTLDCALVD